MAVAEGERGWALLVKSCCHKRAVAMPPVALRYGTIWLNIILFTLLVTDLQQGY